MTCLSPSNFKLIYLIQCCAQKNEFYKLCMKMLMSLQSNNKSRISYLFKSWFKNLIFFFFYAHHYYFCSCKSYHIGFFFNIILIENRKSSDYMKLWRGRIVCLDFYKLFSYFIIGNFLFLHSLFKWQCHDWQSFIDFTKEWPVWLFKSCLEPLIKFKLMIANKNFLWLGTEDKISSDLQSIRGLLKWEFEPSKSFRN